jgi:hypothetical protein
MMWILLKSIVMKWLDDEPFQSAAALYCYPKTKTNMFVIESRDQAAIFRVWNVANISR